MMISAKDILLSCCLVYGSTDWIWVLPAHTYRSTNASHIQTTVNFSSWDKEREISWLPISILTPQEKSNKSFINKSIKYYWDICLHWFQCTDHFEKSYANTHTQYNAHGNAFTIDVLLDPGEGNASLFAAFTEAQQECPRRLWAQDCPLSFFTDEAHNIPDTHTYTQKLDLTTDAVIDVMNYEYCMNTHNRVQQEFSPFIP